MSESTGPGESGGTASSSQQPTAASADQPDKPDKPAKPGKSKAAKLPKSASPEHQERRKTIIRWVVFIGGGAILTVLLYFLLSALIPRWWAQAVGRQADGRIGVGILLGLSYGFFFTLLPLIVLSQALHRSFSWRARVIIVLVAAALTAPNLMTLGISIGTSAAAHAGERTLDVNAPGFRQATLWGAILGAVTAAIVITFLVLWERRGQELKLLRARLDQLEKEIPSTLPPVDKRPLIPPG